MGSRSSRAALRRRALMLAGAVTALLAGAAHAQTTRFNIPAQGLASALEMFGRQSGQQILFDRRDAAGRTSAPLSGEAEPIVALRTLLRGGDLAVRQTGPHTYVVSASGRPQEGAAGPAGPAAPEPAAAVSEIVVTANKREQRLQDVPTSIAVETGAALERRGAIQIEDVIRNTPGLSNPGSGSGNATNLTVRGVTTGTDVGLKQTTVALLFDDIPLDPAVSQSATNPRIVDIERVEVLKGPQGTLFGSGSLSGAIRYITNKPDLRHYGASGEITGAGTEDGAGSYWGNVVLNAPIVEDKLGVRLVGFGYHEGGYVDDYGIGRNNGNLSRTVGGRFALAAKPSDRLSVDVTVAYQNAVEDDANTSDYTTPAGRSPRERVTSGDGVLKSEVNSLVNNLTLKYDLDRVSLTSSSTYIKRAVFGSIDNTFFVPLTTLIAGSPDAPVLGRVRDNYSNSQDIYVQELRASSRGAGPFKWTLGFYYLNSSENGTESDRSPLVVPAIGSDNIIYLIDTLKQEEIAGFGEATYSWRRFDFTAGLRVARTSLGSTTTIGGFLGVFNPSPSAYQSAAISQEETPVTPRFSIGYRVSPDLNVYVQAARGYRIGGPNLATAAGGRAVPNQYASDSLWNYEVGAKGKLFGGKMTYSTDFYYIDWSDLQVSLMDNNAQYVGNAGSAALYGAELQVDSRPFSWLAVGGAVNGSHNALSQDVPTIVRVTGVTGARSGDRLPASPELQLSGYAEYDFRLRGLDSYLRLNTTYIGDEYTDFDEKGSKFGAFSETSLRLGVKFTHYEVVAFANNLFDRNGKTGAQEGFALFPGAGSPQTAYRIRPRTVGLTVRASF